MRPRPPESTRTDPLVPDSPLFRSRLQLRRRVHAAQRQRSESALHAALPRSGPSSEQHRAGLRRQHALMREHLPTMTRALLRGTLAIAHLLIGLLMALVASVDPFDLLNRARLAGSWHRGLLREIGRGSCRERGW